MNPEKSKDDKHHEQNKLHQGQAATAIHLGTAPAQ
jgi:hypothetical protein